MVGPCSSYRQVRQRLEAVQYIDNSVPLLNFGNNASEPLVAATQATNQIEEVMVRMLGNRSNSMLDMAKAISVLDTMETFHILQTPILSLHGPIGSNTETNHNNNWQRWNQSGENWNQYGQDGQGWNQYSHGDHGGQAQWHDDAEQSRRWDDWGDCKQSRVRNVRSWSSSSTSRDRGCSSKKSKDDKRSRKKRSSSRRGENKRSKRSRSVFGAAFEAVFINIIATNTIFLY